MIGMTRGAQYMNLQVNGLSNGIAAHEIMHAVGACHEQSRSDRDSYIQILWQNIQSGWADQFQTTSCCSTQEPYDYLSIMHYGGYSVNIAVTIGKLYRLTFRLAKLRGRFLRQIPKQRLVHRRRRPGAFLGQRLGQPRRLRQH